MSAENRVMGIESEYGLAYALQLTEEQRQWRSARDLPPDAWGADPDSAITKAYANYLPEDLPRAARSPAFLGNGMRLYQDVGSHPEAAGAESTVLQDIIDGDIAADKLLWRTLSKAYKAGAIRNFMLLRRTLDAQGTTWGRHENYRMNRELMRLPESESSRISTVKLGELAPFLAVRPLTGGAGCLHNGEFWMGQKITSAVEDVGSSTTHSKPLVNTRDEPQGTGYRHHVVCVDFTSPHVTAANMAATSLALRMIEHRRGPQLQAPYPNWAFFGRFAATDLSFSYAANVAGKTMTGLDVHELYLEHADRMPQELLSPNEMFGLTAWHAMFDRLKKVQQIAKEASPDDRAMAIRQAIGEHLVGQVDWASRFDYLSQRSSWEVRQHKNSETGITFANTTASAAQADINYDLVGKGTGLGRKYVDRLQAPNAAPYVDDTRVERRILHAPATGRAALREKFLYEFAGDPNTTADWAHIGFAVPELGQLRMQYHKMPDPESSDASELDEFIAMAKRIQPKSLALYEALQREREDRRLAM
ncbi:MAG TPA: proteasome accessory factor PafA2 family protein [Candidatus Saccharimonadales bacterium]|nr:proteasome accessory factor PafA2 family protein [Candidatus Saccharimonadales bacterium]